MGYDTAYWGGWGGIPPQGGLQDDRKATSDRMGWSMGLSPDVRHNDGGSIVGGGDLRLLPPKHSWKVYCDQDYYGLVSSGGEEDGVKGGQAVVVSGQFGPGGDADGDLGGGTNGGVGGDGQDRDRDELNRWEGNVANVILGT